MSSFGGTGKFGTCKGFNPLGGPEILKNTPLSPPSLPPPSTPGTLKSEDGAQGSELTALEFLCFPSCLLQGNY